MGGICISDDPSSYAEANLELNLKAPPICDNISLDKAFAVEGVQSSLLGLFLQAKLLQPML